MKYSTKVTDIGISVQELIDDANIIVVFNDNAPPELAEIAIQHTKDELPKDVSKGDLVRLGNNEYEVTAVGDEASYTLRTLGHCTFKFTGEDEVELPGQIELAGNGVIPDVKVGDVFEIEFK